MSAEAIGDARQEIIDCAGRPDLLAGWGSLADGSTFYVSAPWLAACDTDGVARGHYLTARSPAGRPRAALSAHWSPQENNVNYVAARVVPDAGEAPALVLGGRRGYRSAVLAAADGDSALGSLVTQALARVPEARNRWWWPYLTTDDAQRVMRVTGSSGAYLVEADCEIEVPPGEAEDFIETLPTSKRRVKIRREMRRYAESGLRTVRADLSARTDALGPLLANLQEKYGHSSSAEAMTKMLRRQAAWLDDAAVVFLCMAPDDPTPLGFCLAYRHGDELTARVAGFDYPRLRNAEEYANVVIHEPLRYCQEHNLSRLHLGIGSPEAKVQRGASVRPLWAVASFGQPRQEDVTERARSIAARLPPRESAAFLTAVGELQ